MSLTQFDYPGNDQYSAGGRFKSNLQHCVPLVKFRGFLRSPAGKLRRTALIWP